MKIQILRLETQDTVNSICDKLAWAKTPRVLLAFPRRRPPLLDRLDLTLIQRSALRGGSQLGITTVNRSIKDAANSIGIPVFSSIPAAQRLPWLTRGASRRQPLTRRGSSHNLRDFTEHLQRSQGKPLANGLRVGFFVIGLAGFLAVIGLFIPSAVVELPNGQQTQLMTLKIFPGENVPAVLPGGQLPAAFVSTTVEGQLETAATGEISFAVASARASVTVTNLAEQTIMVPQGTIFVASTDPEARFLTGEPVKLNAGESREIQVEAVLPGSAGNVAAGAIQSVEGTIGLQIQVTNPGPAAGGTDRPTRAASEQDYSSIYDRLLTSLTENAKAAILSESGGQNVLIPGSLRVENVIEQTRSPEVNLPSDRAKLTLKVEFAGMVVRQADLRTAAVSGLDGALPADWQAEPGSLTTDITKAVVIMPDGWVVADLQAARNIHQEFQPDQWTNPLLGKPISTAAGFLQQKLGLDQPPFIRIFPSGWSRMPWLPFRIAWVTK